jgi:hypothetical protein
MKEHLKKAKESLRAAQMAIEDNAALYGKLDELMYAIDDLIEEA